MPDRTRNWDKTPQAQEYRNKYTKEHYTRITYLTTPDFAERIAKIADEAGISKSQLITNALNEYLKDETGAE